MVLVRETKPLASAAMPAAQTAVAIRRSKTPRQTGHRHHAAPDTVLLTRLARLGGRTRADPRSRNSNAAAAAAAATTETPTSTTTARASKSPPGGSALATVE